MNVTFDIGLFVGGGRTYVHKYVRTDARTDGGRRSRDNQNFSDPQVTFFFLTHSAPLRTRENVPLQTFDALKC